MTDAPNEGGSAALTLPEAWTTFIAPFAETLGKNVDDVTVSLKDLVGEPGDQAIALLQDPAMTPDADIKRVLNGTPSAIANKAISRLRSTAASPATAMALGAFDVLPQVPADEAWLTALRTGGVLKVEQSTVISAIRAALAGRMGLFDIPEKLAHAMERFADSNAEPVPEEFFKLRKILTRRNYAEIFEAIDGLDGTFVTDARKRELFARINDHLWPALIGFQMQLKGWIESWQQGAANPAALMTALMSFAGGGGSLPPTMMAPPDSGALRDSADAFNDEMNKVFSGTGIQIASALAVDAGRVKQVLENQRLPALVGAANREQMLRQLGVEVSATYPRLETNLTRYALGIMAVKDQPGGNEELQFFSSLYMLGSQIPWDELNKGGRSDRSARA